MASAVFDELAKPEPRTDLTVGIVDDVSGTSLDVDPSFTTEDPDTVRAVLYGLGSDGTVSANKNTIKIVGARTDLFAQGYFVLDSKKSGSRTVSHLRFGPADPTSSRSRRRSSCHDVERIERNDAPVAAPEPRSCSNTPYGPDEVGPPLRAGHDRQRTSLLRRGRLRGRQGRRAGSRINTVLQTASSRSPTCCRLTAIRRSRTRS